MTSPFLGLKVVELVVVFAGSSKVETGLVGIIVWLESRWKKGNKRHLEAPFWAAFSSLRVMVVGAASAESGIVGRGVGVVQAREGPRGFGRPLPSDCAWSTEKERRKLTGGAGLKLIGLGFSLRFGSTTSRTDMSGATDSEDCIESSLSLRKNGETGKDR